MPDDMLAVAQEAIKKKDNRHLTWYGKYYIFLYKPRWQIMVSCSFIHWVIFILFYVNSLHLFLHSVSTVDFIFPNRFLKELIIFSALGLLHHIRC